MRYYDISKNIQGTRLVYVLTEYAGKFIMVSCYVNERIYIDNVTYISSFDENVLLSFLEEMCIRDRSKGRGAWHKTGAGMNKKSVVLIKDEKLCGVFPSIQRCV